MSYDEKVDVIDFIISVLKEHEKNLDEQVSRLEEIVSLEKPSPPPQELPKAILPNVKVALNKWTEFKERITKLKMLAFTMTDDSFRVSALKDDALFIYQEKIPEVSLTESEGGATPTMVSNLIDLFKNPSVIGGKLQCGLPVEHRMVELKLPSGSVVQKLVFMIENDAVKSWLSEELGVAKTSIMSGTIEI